MSLYYATGGVIPTIADLSMGASSDVLTQFSPSDQGIISWTYDPASAINSSVLPSGVLLLSKVQISRSISINSIGCHVVTAGSGLTTNQCLVGLYDLSGNLLGSSADQSTAWASTGSKNINFSSPIAVQSGFYYIGILSNGTTGPAIARGTGHIFPNMNMTSGAYRFASYSTGLTALPSSLTMTNMNSSGGLSLCLLVL